MTEKKNMPEAGMKAKKETEDLKPVSRFTREQILSSKRYADKRDLISALLEENKMYTLEMIDKLIDEFMKGRVN